MSEKSEAVIKMSGQHKINKCTVCEKWMRTDNLERHMKTHKDLLSLSDEEIEQELRSRHEIQVARETKRQKVTDIANNLGLSIPAEVQDTPIIEEEAVRKRLINNNKVYLQRVTVGEQVSNILSEGEIREESLSKEDMYALDLYRAQRSRVDNINDVVLRPWQREAFELFQQPPNDRTVMWIYDERGNEGKSFFQNYIEAYFGYHRVFRCDLRIKHKDICNILKKRSISTVDIFLFNDSRSIMGDEVNMYRILEDIKDGAATTSKYDNQVLKFKTPNIVMVFSNSWPATRNLSQDRWKIYSPSSDGLKSVTKRDRFRERQGQWVIG